MPKTGKKLKRVATGASATVVFTVGHSTRPIDEFIQLLNAHGIKEVADVRTIPRSRHNPQFNSATLSQSLMRADISYIHLPGLGGLRHTSRASVNTGWRNASFRGFADYMQTPEFEKALKHFMQLAQTCPSALMCAEAVPWRCHRSLIADALVVRDVPVEHIMSFTSRQPHKLTPFARVNGYRLFYPADTLSPKASGPTPSSIKSPPRRPNGTREKPQRKLLE